MKPMINSIPNVDVLPSASHDHKPMLSAGDFVDALKWLLVGDAVEFVKNVSIVSVKYDDLESELKDCKELCRVYAKECGRLQNIILQIPSEILAQYETVHLP